MAEKLSDEQIEKVLSDANKAGLGGFYGNRHWIIVGLTELQAARPEIKRLEAENADLLRKIGEANIARGKAEVALLRLQTERTTNDAG